MMVIKRDGSKVNFDPNKIKTAVSKATKEVYQYNDMIDKISQKALDGTLSALNNLKTFEYPVETIQDIVEDVLMGIDHNVAKAYIRYRFKRQIIRNTTDDAIMELVKGNSEYWNTENSNKDAKNVTTMRDYIAGIVSTDISKRVLLPSNVVDAHEKGIIHFHDADYFLQPINNCCLSNLDDMLQNGTVINKKMIEKPHRFLTAMTIATQIITAVSSSQYGGQTVNLSHLAPFVRDSFNYHKSKYVKRCFNDEDAYIYALQDTQKEIEDGVQTFNYQVNSMSTTNGQTPFLSVFMYLSDNPEYEEETAMIIREFFKQRLLGMKNENGVYVTVEFPKLLYVLEEKNMPGGKYYDLTKLAAKCTAKRMIPDYISEKKMLEYKDGDVYGCMGKCKCSSCKTF